MGYEALRAALAALGVELPVDPSDPRVTPAQLNAWKAELAAKYAELRPTGNLAQLRTVREAETAIKAALTERDELVRLDDERAAEEAAAAKPAETKVVDGASADAGVAAVEPTPPAPDKLPSPDAAAAVIGNVKVNEPQPDDPDGHIELAKVASAQAAHLREGAGNGVPTKLPAKWRTASADVFGTIGTEMDHVSRMAGAMSDLGQAALATVRGGGRFGDKEGRVALASVRALVDEPGANPDGILMRAHGADKNTGIIQAYLDDHAARVAAAAAGSTYERPSAKVAAAPWCEPFDTIREIPDCTDKSTPFRDSLPFVPMGHGGFQFNQGVTLANLSGSVDIWTPDDQAAIDASDPTTWKRCLELSCPQDLPTITLDDWLTACLMWQIGTDLNNPERFRDWFSKLETLRARVTEQWLMSLADVLTINYKNSGGSYRLLGGLNDLILMTLAAFQGAEYDERTVENDAYTMYIDTAQLDTLVAGEIASSSAKTDGTRAGVMMYLREKLPMIQRVVMVRDRVPGAYGTTGANGNPKSALPAINGAAADAPALVTTGTIRIIPTAEVFAFGTGELRTGVKQDFSMARQNMVGWFAEEAIAMTKFGCRPWFKFEATLCSIGRYFGDIEWQVTASDPFSCAYVANNSSPNQPDPFPET